MVVLIDGVNIICNNFPPSHQQEKLWCHFFFAHFGSETKTVPLVEMGTFFLEAATTTTKIGFVYSRYSKKPKTNNIRNSSHLLSNDSIYSNL